MMFRHHLTFLRDKTNGNSHDYSTGREPQLWSKTIFHPNLKAKSSVRSLDKQKRFNLSIRQKPHQPTPLYLFPNPHLLTNE
jgi:hypothetical protein